MLVYVMFEMFSRKILVAVFFASFVFTSFSAHAVDFTLPADGGWYQLQSADGSLTYCESDMTEPCEVPEGTEVKLINHRIARGAPGHLARFTIESEEAVSENVERPQYPSNEIYLLQGAKTNTTTFEMGCPPINEAGDQDAFVVGVACSATDSLGAILPHATEIRYADGAVGSCTADTEANIQMTITCVRTEFREE